MCYVHHMVRQLVGLLLCAIKSNIFLVADLMMTTKDFYVPVLVSVFQNKHILLDETLIEAQVRARTEKVSRSSEF